MTTLIIGANGQIGRLLIQALVRSGEIPRAMVRSLEQARILQELGAQTVIGDLEEDFASAFDGCDKVVFTAGSGANTGPDKTVLVDMWGAVKAVDLARRSGIEHFVMVSARRAEDPDKSPAKIRHYTVCKRMADDHLVESGVTYTILRPGRLTNDPATNQVTTQWPEADDDQWIPREDVANVIKHCLHTPGTKGKIFPLFHGNQSIEDALKS